MELVEYCLLTDSKLQIWNEIDHVVIVGIRKFLIKCPSVYKPNYYPWTVDTGRCIYQRYFKSFCLTFQNNHDKPPHFLCICLGDELSQHAYLYLPVHHIQSFSEYVVMSIHYLYQTITSLLQPSILILPWKLTCPVLQLNDLAGH